MINNFAQSWSQDEEEDDIIASSCVKKKRVEIEHPQKMCKNELLGDVHAKVLMLYENVPIVVKRTIKHALFENPIGICSFFTLHARCITSTTFEPRKFPLVESRFYTVLGLNGVRYSLKGIEDGTFKQELKRYGLLGQNSSSNFKDDILLVNLNTYKKPDDAGEYFACKTSQEYSCSCYKRIHGIHEDVLRNLEVCIKFYPGRTYYVYGFGRFPEKPIASSGIIDYGRYCVLLSIDGHFVWVENKLISNIKFFSEFEKNELPENNTYELNFAESGKEMFERLHLDTPQEVFFPMPTPTLSNKFIAWLEDNKIPTIEKIDDKSSIISRNYHGKPVVLAKAVSYGKRHRPMVVIKKEVCPPIPQFNFTPTENEEKVVKRQPPLLVNHSLLQKEKKKVLMTSEQIASKTSTLPPFQAIEDTPEPNEFDVQQFYQSGYQYSSKAEAKCITTIFSSFATRQDAEKVLFACDYDVHAAYQISLYCHFNCTLIENLLQKFDHDLQTLLPFIACFAFCRIPGQEETLHGQLQNYHFSSEHSEGFSLYRLSLMLRYLRYFTSWKSAVDFLLFFENNGFKAQSVLKKSGKPLSLPDPVEKAINFCKKFKNGNHAYQFLEHFQSITQASEFISRCGNNSDIAVSLLEKNNHNVMRVMMLLERVSSGQHLDQLAKVNPEEQAVIDVLLNMKTS